MMELFGNPWLPFWLLGAPAVWAIFDAVFSGRSTSLARSVSTAAPVPTPMAPPLRRPA